MRSWKGSDEKSGGVATNIGVHFYDMLHFIFGDVLKMKFITVTPELLLDIWSMSVPGCGGSYRLTLVYFQKMLKGEKMTYRSITIAGDELEFSKGFTDLHTQSYARILAGNGYGVAENRAAIETVETIRGGKIVSSPSAAHDLLSKLEA